MTHMLSSNAKAILLLTGHLLAANTASAASPLSHTEYNRLARALAENHLEPASLTSGGEALPAALADIVDIDRLNALLGRGIQLAQSVERWRARGIWLVSRADTEYPTRLKSRLKEHAPPLLFGCGNSSLLATGGLAVVGSRDVSSELITYTKDIGRLAAHARCTIVTGGARGVDEAAMAGALANEGRVVGVLADSLERKVLLREAREMIALGLLLLVTPYDPVAGFNVGNAMQRNKYIYALADAGLVIRSDLGKGGTWAGAVEQLGKYKTGTLFVREHPRDEKGLAELVAKGARVWPNPVTPEALRDLLHVAGAPSEPPGMQAVFVLSIEEESEKYGSTTEGTDFDQQIETDVSSFISDDELSQVEFDGVADDFSEEQLFAFLTTQRSDREVAERFGRKVGETREQLKNLVNSGKIKRTDKPSVKYLYMPPLFE